LDRTNLPFFLPIGRQLLCYNQAMLEGFSHDVRYALRVLRRSPRNTAIALAILAVGIGSNTAMFSAINHVLLRPLPFPDDGGLVRLRDVSTGSDGQPHPFNMASRSVLAVRTYADVFEAVVGMSADNMTMTGGELAERVSVVRQTDGIERTLAIQPMLGRGFTAEEQRKGTGSGVALVSHALWQTRLGGSASALGSQIRLDDQAFTVVGVMPPQYAFPYQAQVWIPHVLDAEDRNRDFAVWARLKPGVTPSQLRSSLAGVAAHVTELYPGVTPNYSVEVMTIRENLVGTQTSLLRALTNIVALLLLIACVNVATLLLARGVSRRREFAVRAALGASRGRHVQQLLAESLVLAAFGCIGGLLLASWIAPLTSRLMPGVFSDQLGIAIPQTDWRVAAFAIAASLVSAIVAGVIPAFGNWRRDPRSALTDGGRTLGIATSGRRLLGALIVTETALTLILLAGSGLVIRNFVRLQTQHLGFDGHGLLTMELTPPVSRFAPGEPRTALMRRVIEEAQVEPGVLKAAATTVNPIGGGTWGAPVVTEESAAKDPGATANVNHRLISPGLFNAMGIPLLRGRDITDQDRAGAPTVVIVSDLMAHHFWPNKDPIGKRVRIARPNQPWLTVIGIAGNVSDSHFPGVPHETWYVPYAQHAETAAAERIYLMVRTTGDALSLVLPVQRAIARVDKTLAPYNPKAMDSYYGETISRERVSAGFMLGFGAFGLILAALGIYGVMAFSVAQRTAEFGIRMALGADVHDILPLVLKRSGALVAAGAAVGLAAAVALNRMLASLLDEVGVLDLPVLTGAAALVLVTASIACFVPARAASRLDPVAALRTD
jgi:putative ABC transport system permease protein